MKRLWERAAEAWSAARAAVGSVAVASWAAGVPAIALAQVGAAEFVECPPERSPLAEIAAAAAAGANGVCPSSGYAGLTGPNLADAYRMIGDALGRPLEKESDLAKIARETDPRKLEERRKELVDELRKLERDYAKLVGGRGRASKEYRETFGEFDARLAAVGLTVATFFKLATSSPIDAAARLKGAATAENAALYDAVVAIVDRIATEEIETTAAQLFNRKDLKKEAKQAILDDAMARANARLEREVSALHEACRPGAEGDFSSNPRYADYYRFGIDRFAATRAGIRSGFPSNLGLAIGSPAWKAHLDVVAGPESCASELSVIADPGDYWARLSDVVDHADAVLAISLLKLEADLPSTTAVAGLALEVRNTGNAPTAQSVVDKIVAKALEMPEEAYSLLRRRFSAASIRDLRIAQEQLHRNARAANPLAKAPAIDSAEVVRAAAKIQQELSEDERKAIAEQLFTRTDVRLIRDGKLIDLGYIGNISNLATLALNPLGKLKSLIAPPGKTDLLKRGTELGGIAGNDAEPLRHARSMLGERLAWVEDTAHFVAHPKRSVEGAARDLIDVGIPVVDDFKLLRKGLPTPNLGINHEKLVYSVDDQGLARVIASGNNVGTKHFPTDGKDGKKPVYRWHDFGIYAEGGADSLPAAIGDYLAEHYNRVAKEEKDLTPSERARWRPTASTGCAATGRFLDVEPGVDNKYGATTMSLLAAANKRVVIGMPFFSGEGFRNQVKATAARWMKEGWDPSRRWNPDDPNDPCWTDPACRQFTVVVPGWLDSGIAQFASYKLVNEFKEMGVDVRMWRPDYGRTVTPDGKSVYHHDTMAHGKYVFVEEAPGRGAFSTGSGNLTNPNFYGWHREGNIYTEDATVLAEARRKIITPDLANSATTGRRNAIVNAINTGIERGTRPFQ